jgi:ketosteroid isomerase-like protein
VRLVHLHRSTRREFKFARAALICSVASLVPAFSMLSACATADAHREVAVAIEEVRQSELAFAKSMADRDFQSFVDRLSPDAAFFDGGSVTRGRTQVASAWKPYFTGAKAPFSWTPDQVEVLASGDLALSTGPVMAGDRPVGRFNSIWRLEAPHTWRIVFDKGETECGAASR